MKRIGAWTAIALGIAVAIAVAQRDGGVGIVLSSKPPAACTADVNATFEESITNRRRVVEGVTICGTVSGRPYEMSSGHGLHAYIPVRVVAPGGVIYITQVIPNEQFTGHISVREGDSVIALGQLVYPNNNRRGYDGLIHDTHRATHRGAVDGYLVINGTVYK